MTGGVGSGSVWQHLDQLNQSHYHHHLVHFRDQTEFIPLILASQHENKNQQLNHHMKQKQLQEKNKEAWEWGHDEPKYVGIFHCVVLASFLFFPRTLVQETKPHLK